MYIGSICSQHGIRLLPNSVTTRVEMVGEQQRIAGARPFLLGTQPSLVCSALAACKQGCSYATGIDIPGGQTVNSRLVRIPLAMERGDGGVLAWGGCTVTTPREGTFTRIYIFALLSFLILFIHTHPSLSLSISRPILSPVYILRNVYTCYEERAANRWENERPSNAVYALLLVAV